MLLLTGWRFRDHLFVHVLNNHNQTGPQQRKHQGRHQHHHRETSFEWAASWHKGIRLGNANSSFAEVYTGEGQQCEKETCGHLLEENNRIIINLGHH